MMRTLRTLSIIVAMCSISTVSSAGPSLQTRYAFFMEEPQNGCKPYQLDMKQVAPAGELCQWIGEGRERHVECNSADCAANRPSKHWCPKERSDDDPVLVYKTLEDCKRAASQGDAS